MVHTLHIVVVLYNSADTFTSMWSSLVCQSSEDWHLIAIDNKSADASSDVLRSISDQRITKVRNDSNVGYARAVNQGLQIASARGAKNCMLLNPDTVLPPGFLADLIETWTMHNWAVIAPRIMKVDDPLKSWYAGGHLDYGWVFANRHDEFSPSDSLLPRQVDFASGCCLGLSVDTLRRIGLLDESFFVYWEDTDYCLRLKAAGIPVMYLPHPMLLHEGGASSGGEASPAATKLFYTSYALLLRKHFGFRAALKMAFRALRREWARTHQAPRHTWTVAASLSQGLFRPILPEPQLP